MHQNQLKGFKSIQLVQLLTPQEQEQFYLWLALHQAKNQLVELYRYIQNNSTTLPIPYSHNKVYFRKLSSDLGHLIETFLAWKKLESDAEAQSIFTLKAFGERHQEDLFQKEVRHLEAHLKQPYWRYQLELEKFNQIYAHQRTVVTNSKTLNTTLEEWYILEKLRLIVLQYSHKQLFDSSLTLQDESYVLSLAQQVPYVTIKRIQVFVKGIQCLKEQNVTTFETFYKILNEDHQGLDPSDYRHLLTIALNFCIQAINKGEKQYEELVFSMYKKGLEAALFIEKGQLSAITYKNTMIAGINIKAYEWVEQAITQYKVYLKEETQSYPNFCFAKLYFEQTNYKKALKYLRNVDYEDELLSLNAKTMLVKIYYETGEFQLLESLLDSFKSYIQRKSLQKNYKNHFKAFVKTTSKLINTFTEKQFLTLQKEVNTTPTFASKQWVLEKINEQLESSLKSKKTL